MYGVNSENGYTEIGDGIRIKTLCHDDSMLMSELWLQEDSVIPEHTHPDVQTGYLIKGKIRLTINEDVRTFVPGDSWCIQADLKHRTDALEDSVILEVFSPQRKDYMKYVNDLNLQPVSSINDHQ
ncbi:MAG TPA: cupin domain-containing protein [Prolixibacteraceae bacterium]|jgi:quercetin dioxygenase-like cupin family protein|nr:cupin domain-containing protein [Prolixibacteraceae bacterium]